MRAEYETLSVALIFLDELPRSRSINSDDLLSPGLDEKNGSTLESPLVRIVMQNLREDSGIKTRPARAL